MLYNVMAKNAETVVYLADHKKINTPSPVVVMTADELDVIVTDYIFGEEFKKKYNNIEFIEVK